MLYGHPTQPLRFPPNMTGTIWERGDGAYSATVRPHLATFSPDIVANLVDDQELDVTSLFGGATYFPYNTSRTLKFSSASDWSNFTGLLVYQNAYGFYLENVLTMPSAGTQVEFGLPFGQATQPSANFFYVNKIISFSLSPIIATTPATPLFMDWGLQGMTQLTVMNSGSHYWGSSLQVLGLPATVMGYTAYIDDYPMMVSDIQPVYSSPTQSLVFGNTIDTPYTSTTTPPDAANWISQLMTTPFQLAANTTAATTSQIAQVPYAVGTVRVQIANTNTSKLLITLLQNASAF